MRSKFKVLKSIFIFGLLLLPAWPNSVQAQGDPPLYCAELSTEDCEILAASREAMMDLRSVSSDVAFEFIMSDIPDVPFDEITLNIEQQTAYMLGDEGLAVRAKFSDVDLVTELLQEDPAGFLELYAELIEGSTMDSTFRISVSEDTMALIQEAIEEDSGDPIPFALPNEFGISSRLIDGTMYTNLSEMLDPLPGIKTIGDVWFGFEYAPMMELSMAAARADGDLEPMSADEAPMVAQLIASLAGTGGGPLITTVAGLPFSEDVIPSLSVERLDDGSEGIRFRTVVDYATLLSEPIVKELLADLIRDPDFGDMDMSDDEMTETLAVIQLMGPTVLDSLGLEVIEEIDPETGLMLGSEFHLNWDIDALAPMITMAGGPDLSELEAMPVISLNGTAAHSDHNSELVIEMPETALIISTEEIMELIPEEELQMLLSDSEPEFDFAEAETETAGVDAEAAAAAALAAVESVPVTAEQQAKAELMLDQARVAVDDEEYAYAITLLDAVLEIDPTNVAAYDERGMAYYWQDEPEQAIADFSVSLQLDPQNAQTLAKRATANSDSGLYEEALADYEAALEIDPELGWIYADRAELYYYWDEYELSIADYNSAIEFDASNPFLFFDRALVHYAMDQIDNEIADYTTAIVLKPDYTLAYYYRALSYEELGISELALADYDKVAELEPERSDIYFDRGTLHQEAGNNAEAIADFERYLELEPDAFDREDVEAIINELR